MEGASLSTSVVCVCVCARMVCSSKCGCEAKKKSVAEAVSCTPCGTNLGPTECGCCQVEHSTRQEPEVTNLSKSVKPQVKEDAIITQAGYQAQFQVLPKPPQMVLL